MRTHTERVVGRSLSQSYERLVSNQQSLFEGRDPEGVHQARVATRRLRADLRTFERFVDEDWSRQMRGELRWLGADLGLVRDIEVMLERLHTHASQLLAAETDAVEHALRRLRADRTAARATLLSSLRSPRYAELRRALAAAAANPPLTPRGRKASRKELRRVVHKRWTQLRRSVKRLGEAPGDDALHNVRIRAKRCRYATEACVPVFGAPARRFARAITGVQDALGEHHDAVVSVAWIAKTAQESDAGEAYALGRLAEIEYGAARDAREELRHAWKRARRGRLRRWL